MQVVLAAARNAAQLECSISSQPWDQDIAGYSLAMDILASTYCPHTCSTRHIYDHYQCRHCDGIHSYLATQQRKLCLVLYCYYVFNNLLGLSIDCTSLRFLPRKISTRTVLYARTS